MKMMRIKAIGFNSRNKFWVKEKNKKKWEFWNMMVKRNNNVTILKIIDVKT